MKKGYEISLKIRLLIMLVGLIFLITLKFVMSVSDDKYTVLSWNSPINSKIESCKYSHFKEYTCIYTQEGYALYFWIDKDLQTEKYFYELVEYGDVIKKDACKKEIFLCKNDTLCFRFSLCENHYKDVECTSSK